MYERFTDRSRKAMQLANQEAQRFNHEYIGTEHILLGLVSEGTGVAANVLKNLGVDLHRIRTEVTKIVEAGPDMVASEKLPQTPRAKRVIEFALEESRSLNHNYIGTEHLLLGLLREDESVAAQVLMNLGLRLTSVREEVLNLLASNVGTSPLPRSTSPDDSIKAPPIIVRAIAALETSVDVLNSIKEGAVARQDFEWAAGLRDQTDKLRKIREWLMRNKDRESEDESESPQS